MGVDVGIGWSIAQVMHDLSISNGTKMIVNRCIRSKPLCLVDGGPTVGISRQAGLQYTVPVRTTHNDEINIEIEPR